MKKLHSIVTILLGLGIMNSCGTADSKESKMVELEKYKTELAELESKIAELESEVSPPDQKIAEVLVSSFPIKPSPFYHEIEVRGSVQSRKNVMISSETMGRIEKINVKEGQQVKAGQVLIELDADVLQNNIAEVETSLDLADAVHKRQKNLWDQNIGTEMQYLQSKNNKESLERRLATLRSQLKQFRITAPFGGTVDHVPVKVGEMMQPGVPAVRVLNQSDMYIQADVSEAYLGKLRTGDAVEVFFPVYDKRFTESINSVSGVINPENRTFIVELNLPTSLKLAYKPNQIVILKMTDYINEQAITVPTRLIQRDGEGKFVYAVTDKDDKKTARKVRITTGKSYNSRTEVLTGLNAGTNLIDKGFREVMNGSGVKLVTSN